MQSINIEDGVLKWFELAEERVRPEPQLPKLQDYGL
jgi:hypothetical protein